MKSLQLMLLVFPALLSWNCISPPDKPVAPSWDVNLTVPLANRTYTLAEIVEKDTNMLKVGVGNQIMYTTNVSTQPTYVGDLIALDIPSTTMNMRLGAFQVSTPPMTVPIAIPWLPQGMTIPIPDTTVSFGEVKDTIPSFESMSFESGTMTLTLTNNLPVVMEVTAPIRLLDGQGNVVLSFNFSQSSISPNSSRSAVADLAGKSLDKVIRLTGMSFHTPGSPTPVQIPTGDLLVASLTTNNLVAQQATLADIPTQLLSNTDTAAVTLDDSTLIKEVHLSSGALNLTFENNVNLAMYVRLALKEMHRGQGSQFVPFVDSVFLAPGGSTTLAINLANTKIESPDGQLLTKLNFVTSMKLITTPGQPVTLSSTDNVRIGISQSAPIIVDTAIAVLKPTWVSVNTALAIDFGDLPSKFHGQLNVPSAFLAFNTQSSIGFPVDLNVQFSARKANGSHAYLNVPSNQKRLASGSDQIVFDPVEVGTFLSQFSGGLPESLFVIGHVLVNPPDAYTPTLAGVGSVGAGSSFGGDVLIEVPLMLGITNGSYIDTLTFGDTTGDGDRDVLVDPEQTRNVNYGKVHIEVQNGLPLQVSVNGNLLNGVRQSMLLLPQSGQPLVISAAMVDADGNVTIPAKSTLLVEMDREDVDKLNFAEFIALGVSLNTSSGGQVVRFKTSDELRVRMWSQLSYKVIP